MYHDFEKYKFIDNFVFSKRTFTNHYLNETRLYINIELHKLIRAGLKINTAPPSDATKKIEKPLEILMVESGVRKFVEKEIEKEKIEYLPNSNFTVKIKRVIDVNIDYVNLGDYVINWTAYIKFESKDYLVKRVEGKYEGFEDDGYFTNAYLEKKGKKQSILKVESLDKLLLL